MEASDRPTAWWVGALERRLSNRDADEDRDLRLPVTFASDEEKRAALKFFNAAYRAEESGLAQAHVLSALVEAADPELARALRLYGDEEGWHRQLLADFLEHLGGSVQPMGRVTGLLFRLYARARRMDTILLTNLMFETIGSTTYRLTLARVENPAVKRMLTILTRDEAFHVPLNVHFLKRKLANASELEVLRLRAIFHVFFLALVLLPIASRPKSRAFDRIETLELARAYARELSRVFSTESGLPLVAPRLLLALLGVDGARRGDEPHAASVLAAERAEDRASVRVTALSG
ncbi:MAG TPA: ferritin-like domain-containing protein [Polyangiaceae bacterium]|nr:ferritin-like domain-containing protein [Polyangiaceae bacterium]